MCWAMMMTKERCPKNIWFPLHTRGPILGAPKEVKYSDFVMEKGVGISVTHEETVHGYARCSTAETRQDINRQVRELTRAGAEHIWIEYEHGDAANKEQQSLMFSASKPGDTIVTLEVSRLCRSTRQICEIIDTVRDRRLRLIILGSITMDCRNGTMDPMTEAFMQISGVFAQLELSLIRARVKSGMENARTKGKRIGRPPVTTATIPDSFFRYFSRYQSGQINLSELARLCQISRPTVYRYIATIERAEKG